MLGASVPLAVSRPERQLYGLATDVHEPLESGVAVTPVSKELVLPVTVAVPLAGLPESVTFP